MKVHEHAAGQEESEGSLIGSQCLGSDACLDPLEGAT